MYVWMASGAALRAHEQVPLNANQQMVQRVRPGSAWEARQYLQAHGAQLAQLNRVRAERQTEVPLQRASRAQWLPHALPARAVPSALRDRRVAPVLFASLRLDA